MFLLTIAGGILIAVAILVVVALAGLAISANWEHCAPWFGAAFVVLLLWAAGAYVGQGLAWFLILFCVASFVAGMVEAAGSVAEAMTILRRMVRRG